MSQHTHRFSGKNRLIPWVGLVLLASLLGGCASSKSYGMAGGGSAPRPTSAASMHDERESVETDADGKPNDEKPKTPDAPEANINANFGGVFAQVRGDKKAATKLAVPVPKGPKTPGSTTSTTPVEQKDTTKSTAGPLLIYQAEVNMAVFEVTKQINAVEKIAREMHGFLAKRTDNSITFRIPVARFDEALKKVTSLGDELHRDVSVKDVSEQYSDLEIRLKNAMQVRDRLAELLKRADKVKDALEIQRELANVTEQIERMEGKMRFLRDRASFSTITIHFEPKRIESRPAMQMQIPFAWLGQLGLQRLLNLH
jgi:hypothetical protein